MIGRISLPRTTAVSLNDRFSTMRHLRERQQEEARQLQQQQHASLASSRHLVDQMESRPAVRAALGGHQQTVTPVLPAPPPSQKRLHVKQRLAIQSRLGVMRTAPGGAASGGGGGGGGGALSARLGRGANINKRLQTARSPLAVGQRSAAGRGRGRASRGSSFTGSRPRGGLSASRGRGRGGAGPRGAARGQGRGRGAASAPVRKEDLDAELDSYMSGTRGKLDAELDAYMKEAE